LAIAEKRLRDQPELGSKSAGPRSDQPWAKTPGPVGGERGRPYVTGDFGKGNWPVQVPPPRDNRHKWASKRDPANYEPRTYERRENPVGMAEGSEPRIPRGVTRERTATYVRDRATWELQANVNKGRTYEDGICTFSVGGRRSYTTLTIEGISDGKTPREMAQALREFGPINFLYFARSKNRGFSGLGYVNYVYAVNADEAMREFTMRRGNRVCFARPCFDSVDILRMSADDLTAYQVTPTGNEDVIFNLFDESWGKPSFGKTGNRHDEDE
jgi:hypothetical protein